MSVEMIGLTISILGIIIGAVWWMAALYHRVGTISLQIRRFQSHLISELGGVTDSGELVKGNQTVVRQELKRELEDQIDALKDRVIALEHSFE